MKQFKLLTALFFIACLLAGGCSENGINNTSNRTTHSGSVENPTDDIEYISVFVQYQETPFPDPPVPEPDATVRIYNSSGTTLLWEGTTASNGYVSVTSSNCSFTFVVNDSYMISATTYYKGNAIHYGLRSFTFEGNHTFVRVITYPS